MLTDKHISHIFTLCLAYVLYLSGHDKLMSYEFRLCILCLYSKCFVWVENKNQSITYKYVNDMYV